MTRIADISADAMDIKLDEEDVELGTQEALSTFPFGSQENGYAKITDANRIKYSDPESVLDNSKDDCMMVTLTNGGSYQKNGPSCRF
jgi:hypothetical protein